MIVGKLSSYHTRSYQDLTDSIMQRLEFLLNDVCPATLNPVFLYQKRKCLKPKNRWQRAMEKLRKSSSYVKSESH